MQQYWETHWSHAQFDREYATNYYPRRQEEFAAIQKWLPRVGLILEAGCSYGHVVKYFQEQGYQVWGLDYAFGALTLGHAAQSDLPLVQGDIHMLPLATNSLAGYLSFGVLEHFEMGPKPALQEAFRVLRPGGVIAVTMPLPTPLVRTWLPRWRRWDPLAPLKRHSTLRRLFGKAPLAPRPATPKPYFYEQPYTPAQVKAYFDDVGFEMLMQVPIYHSLWLWLVAPAFRDPVGYYKSNTRAEQWARLLKQLWPWHTAFFSLAVARKPE
jgi:SAM-dependent methyltransferase